MADCIFCEIAAGNVPSRTVYEDDHVRAFHDLNPVAPVHVLLNPKAQVSGVSALSDDHVDTMGRLLVAARTVARELDIEDSGYRLVINDGRDACQTVFHLHLHLLGGRNMPWPPYA